MRLLTENIWLESRSIRDGASETRSREAKIAAADLFGGGQKEC